MADKNLILYLPMDDPGTSVVAYDYSNSRADAQLSGGAHFSKDAKIASLWHLVSARHKRLLKSILMAISR